MSEFSADWQQIVHRTMDEVLRGLRPNAELMIARFNNRIAGFAHIEDTRFGPFGVASALRGKGIGSALLSESLRAMAARGKPHAWFMWTGDETAKHVYTPCGFVETHRWAVFAKDI
jgi:GNAT superfamily N-acetyltransferase